IVLTHGLEGDTGAYVVDLEGRSSDLAVGTNIRAYGGMDYGTAPEPGHSAGDQVGAYWRSLDEQSITVVRRTNDTFDEQVRIRIWSHPQPAYNSGWFHLSPGSSVVLTHTLGGDVGSYAISAMQWETSTASTTGVNIRAYGGMDYGANPPS